MAINFITGLPRQGKTLFTICFVKEKAEKEKRQVYYCNIPEVTIPGWIELENPNQWLDLPDNALVIVDELQDFWGMASAGARVPEPILELSKHGKRGIDFYFITQDPSLVHITPRKLCEWHYHVIRAFGTQSCTVHKFYRMQIDPDKVKTKSEKIIWPYKKEVFGKKDKQGNWVEKPWYKSADVHNIKRQIPWRVWALPLFALLAIGMLYFTYTLFQSTMAKTKQVASGGSAAAASASVPGTAAQPPSPSRPGAQGGTMTTAEYLASFKPRVPGFTHSAPRYDQVTQPVVAPYPAACMEMQKQGCKCYTQQGTLMAVPDDLCKQIVQQGFFLDWQQPEPKPLPVARQVTGYHEPPVYAMHKPDAATIRP